MSAQLAPGAAVAGVAAAPGVLHSQAVGKGIDGTIAKLQAAVALQVEPAAPVA